MTQFLSEDQYQRIRLSLSSPAARKSVDICRIIEWLPEEVAIEIYRDLRGPNPDIFAIAIAIVLNRLEEHQNRLQ